MNFLPVQLLWLIQSAARSALHLICFACNCAHYASYCWCCCCCCSCCYDGGGFCTVSRHYTCCLGGDRLSVCLSVHASVSHLLITCMSVSWSIRQLVSQPGSQPVSGAVNLIYCPFGYCKRFDFQLNALVPFVCRINDALNWHLLLISDVIAVISCQCNARHFKCHALMAWSVVQHTLTTLLILSS